MSGKRNYRYNHNSYNTSSAAYAYQTEVLNAQPIYEDSILTERDYRRKAQEVEIKRANAIETAIEKRERLVHRIKLSVAVLGVFSGCFVTMASYALVAEQRVENTKLSDQLIGIQNENASLQAEISDKVDLEYIESEAVNRLGMAEPQPYQIMYIDVPKQSYTVQYGAVDSEEKEKFSIASIVSLFKS
jgi:cell division protein FtsB